MAGPVIDRYARRRELHRAALPAGINGGFPHRGLQARVVVTGDELHAVKAAAHEGLQELPPAGTVFARSEIDAKHRSLTLIVHPDHNHQGHANDSSPFTDFREDGIEPYVPVGFTERAGAECSHVFVEGLGHARNHGLVHAVNPDGVHQIIHFARANTLHVRLGEDVDQRAICPPPRFQQAGQKRASPKFGDLEVESPCRRVELSGTTAVPNVGALSVCALVPLSSNGLGQLRLNDRLRQALHGFSQELDARVRVGRAEQIEQCNAEVSAISVYPPDVICGRETSSGNP